MNWLLIVIGCIILFCVITGYRKGGTRTGLLLVIMTASIVLALFLLPYISEILTSVTPIDTQLREKYRMMSELEETDIENSRLRQIKLMEEANIPDVYKEALIANNNYEVYQRVDAQNFTEYVGAYISYISERFLVFLCTFIIAFVIFHKTIHSTGILDWIEESSVSSRIMGTCLGIGTGILTVWIVFCFVILMYDFDIGKLCYTYIHESRILEFLYDQNMFIKYIIRL